MRNFTRLYPVALALVLALWLILGFWPLGGGSRIFLSIAALLLAGGLGGYLWRQSGAMAGSNDERMLPPEHFEGAVVLACGDSEAVFASDCLYRETRQGWYIPVREPEQLGPIAESLFSSRPALAGQVSVMLAIVPERWQDASRFASQLHQWQRAIAQSRRAFSAIPPVWGCVWLNPPENDEVPTRRWCFLDGCDEGIQVQEEDTVSGSYLSWCEESSELLREGRLQNALWLQLLFRWLKPQVLAVMNTRHHDTPALPLQMLAVCSGPVRGSADNLWQQQVAGITTLAPAVRPVAGPPALPDLLLSRLPHRHGVSRTLLRLRTAGLLTGLFLLLAMGASYINNQRLIQNVRDHLALYQRLPGSPAEPKLRMQNQLRRDEGLLERWQREGAPMRYTLGLYQGMRLIPPLRAAIDGWAPPPPPAPVINKIVRGPETIRLDSMSLFDSGKAQLKAGSTKMLINSLVG
ncbi:OmpA family protein, partial [uncultured Pluralibacter sp.]|uniref:OmpA family protein n=1 Tax=uncultured Pluralibacter sp. TaxID=1490864 RepID=UPI002613CC87